MKLQDQTCKAIFHNTDQLQNLIRLKESPRTMPNKINKEKKKFSNFLFEEGVKAPINKPTSFGSYNRFSLELNKLMMSQEMVEMTPSNPTLNISTDKGQDPQKYTDLANNVY